MTAKDRSLKLRTGLNNFQTLVVKVGSKILSTNRGESSRITRLVKDITDIRKMGKSVILVSSGAVAHGVLALDLKKRPSTIPLKQACASIGQIKLMHMYEKMFSMYDMHIGQVLLTKSDLNSKNNYLNLRNTMFTLLENGVIPIVNENDSVGVDELRFGDNDTLGAQIALLSGADLFVNLSDINGLYDSNPKKNKDAKHIPLVKSINSALHAVADDKGTDEGVGGMVTKLKAAETVCKSGIVAIIGDGFNSSLIDVLTSPQWGTLFLPATKKISFRQRWMKYTGKVYGTIYVDSGAVDAIVYKGKSILPVGIKEVKGDFNERDFVDIADLGGSVFARGFVNFNSDDVRKIMGHRTNEIKKILGSEFYNNVIHRNNMVIV